jgi:uncharacterized membrane protein
MTGTAAPSGAHAHRVIFIDLGRFLALIFMLYGHTVSALLSPAYQRGAWFEVWQFQRGLTASLFLLLSGLAFSVATSRHWGAHQAFSSAMWRRVRRFALFVLLGYSLHFPVGRFVQLGRASEEQWRSFLAVDVLQLIGVTYLLIQALVFASRSRLAFAWLSVALAVAVVAATDSLWAAEWVDGFPPWAAAYLSPTRSGSLFPLFPWAAYVLVGSALGQLYVGWGASRLARYTVLALLLPGAALVGVSWWIASLEAMNWSAAVGSVIALQVPTRVGACLLILAGIAYLSQRLAQLPRLFTIVGQETLLIYFVHLCLVYGSVWNLGLVHAFGAALGPVATLFWVIVLLFSMVGLGRFWHWLKYARPRAAGWAMAGAALLLTARLL